MAPLATFESHDGISQRPKSYHGESNTCSKRIHSACNSYVYQPCIHSLPPFSSSASPKSHEYLLMSLSDFDSRKIVAAMECPSSKIQSSSFHVEIDATGTKSPALYHHSPSTYMLNVQRSKIGGQSSMLCCPCSERASVIPIDGPMSLPAPFSASARTLETHYDCFHGLFCSFPSPE
jgi:hypothetical protein